MENDFEAELKFFIKHQEELVEKHSGKFLVIRGESLLGAYDTPLDALRETLKRHAPGTFMIQRCWPGPDAYTVTISSSVISV